MPVIVTPRKVAEPPRLAVPIKNTLEIIQRKLARERELDKLAMSSRLSLPPRRTA
jgi:hypothetical protein